MRFSESDLKMIISKGHGNMTIEDEINFNILNFIHCIHLNGQDFYSESFSSKFYGDLEIETH